MIRPRIALLFVLAPLLGAGTFSATAAAACRPVQVPVTLVERTAPATHLAGTLCGPAVRRARVVQLLVHGSTYDRRYWDWPGHGGRYSYVRAMVRAGYATLAIDRLGSGRSPHPAAGLVSYANHVRTVAQTTRWLHSRFDAVVLVGHSYGTLVAAGVANRDRDVAAVVATGATTSAGPSTTGGLAACLVDARTDPATQSLVPADGGGYLTSRPGCRGPLFFAPETADAAVIAEDEARKGTLTPAEVAGTPLSDAAQRWPVADVRAPTLVAIGGRDALFCAPTTVCQSAAGLRASERPAWRRAPLSTLLQPGTGHDLNLHRTAPAFFAATTCWLRARVPAHGPRTRCDNASISPR